MIKLLYIDDETIIFKYARRLFKKIELIGAADSKQAMEILSHQTIDAVLTDNLLPGMNGVELAAELNKTYPSLPIFLTSGDWNPEFDKLIEQGTLRGFFAKPFQYDEIEKSILEHVK